MASDIRFNGTVSYSYNPTAWTVDIKAAEIDNKSSSPSGSLRLEMWLTADPWNAYSGSNHGYKVATYPLAATTDGILGANKVLTDIDAIAALSHPPAGSYFVTISVAEYTGANLAVDDGYVIDDTTYFSNLLVFSADGSISKSVNVLPDISIASRSLVEGDSGSANMVFTLTLSKAVNYATSVQLDTIDETAFAGFDYTGFHQRVSFAAGQSTATVSIPILGNEYLQSDRAFELSLSDAVGIHLTPNHLDPIGTVQNRTEADAWGVIVDDDRPAGLPTDPLFPLQWYLMSTRVEIAWELATGKGVTVAIFDQGIDPLHPELKANDQTALGITTSTGGAGGAPVTADDDHGTMVAGVIGAARDGVGTVGVAYDAKLVPLYTSAIYSTQYLTEIANAFHYAAKFDVLNNSWGFGNLLKGSTNWAFLDDAKSTDFAPAFDALRDLATTGRHGLGTVVVQSAGNGYNVGDDTNLHNFQNSRYIITVGATDYLGRSSSFSTTGASILVAAPGGEGYRDYASILTTDRSGAAGENSGNYALTDGTSFSSPVVAGVVALMLEANPNLGYRDVQQILAYTAHQTESAGNWVANGAHDWNGGGLRYDSVYQASGFGEVDALGAVRLASTWSTPARTAANAQDVIASKTTALAIADNSDKGVSSTIAVTSDITVERAEVTVNITHPFIGDLEILLTSPTGTTSYLMYRPAAGSLSALGSSQHDIHFTFDTVLDLGEKASGNWTLNVRDLQSGNVGTFDSWTLDLVGRGASAAHMFVFTNEYPDLVAEDAGRSIIKDPGGVNSTINLGALGTVNRIDLSGATVSSVYDTPLTIAAGTTIRNAIGGFAEDTLIANAAGSVLRGMDGNDTLIGGAGIDTAVYNGTRAQYTVTKTAGGLQVSDLHGKDGVDQLSQIDRLQFTDGAYALDINGVGGEAYRLYQAAFNRVPDAGGLGFWIHFMDGGMSENQVAAGFMASPEFIGIYGSAPTHQKLVDTLYQNVLHRPGEASGVKFWLDALDNPAITPAAVLAAFAESAENKAALIGVIGDGFGYTPYG